MITLKKTPQITTVSVVGSDHFIVHKDIKTLSIDMSELQYVLRNQSNIFGRLEVNSHLVGIKMVSQNTGKIANFACYNQQFDRGRIECYPTRACLEAIPELKGWKIVIFND